MMIHNKNNSWDCLTDTVITICLQIRVRKQQNDGCVAVHAKKCKTTARLHWVEKIMWPKDVMKKNKSTFFEAQSLYKSLQKKWLLDCPTISMKQLFNTFNPPRFQDHEKSLSWRTEAEKQLNHRPRGLFSDQSFSANPRCRFGNEICRNQKKLRYSWRYLYSRGNQERSSCDFDRRDTKVNYDHAAASRRSWTQWHQQLRCHVVYITCWHPLGKTADDAILSTLD